MDWTRFLGRSNDTLMTPELKECTRICLLAHIFAGQEQFLQKTRSKVGQLSICGKTLK